MIYSFDKKTNKFIGEYESVAYAAAQLKTTQKKVQKVLDGLIEDINGIGLIMKPDLPEESRVEQSYYEAQKDTFYRLTDSLCKWEQATQFHRDDSIVLKNSINIGRAIKLLKDGFIAIPF